MTQSTHDIQQMVDIKCAIKQRQIVKDFIHLIESHYTEGLKIEKYAQKMFISLSKLDRCCKAIYQKTATELINRRIIEEAKKMLITTDAPIKQIAWDLGKSYESNFIAFFNREKGMSPTRYRRIVAYQNNIPSVKMNFDEIS